MLETYLRDLERELARTLPYDDMAQRLAEAETHLREGIEGRIELGLSEPEAVREAIDAFGAVQRIGRAIASEPSPQARMRVLLGAMTGGVLLFHLLWAIVPAPAVALAATALLYVGAISAFCVLAYRSRRPATSRLLLGGLLGTLAVWLAFGMTSVGRPGSGILPRERLASYRRSLEREIVQGEQNSTVLARQVHRLNALGTTALKDGPGFRMPIESSPWDSHPLVFRSTVDPKQAAEELRRVARNMAAGTACLRADVANLDRAESSLARNLLEEREVPEANLVLLAAFVLLDGFFARLGAFAVRSRRRRGSGTLA